SQSTDDLVCRQFPTGERLERNKDKTAIRLPLASCESDHVGYGGVLLDDFHEASQLLLHQLKGDTLVGLDVSDQDTRVLLREKPFWHDGEKIDVETKGPGENEHQEPRMRQRTL